MKGKVIFTVLAVVGLAFGISQAPAPTTSSYIVQGSSIADVKALVSAEGGEITHELGVIRAVGATLTPAQVEALRAQAGIQRIYGNGSIEVAGKPNSNDQGGGTSNTVQETNYPTRVLANSLHASGIDGSGVGIAVLDTGLWKHDGIKNDAAGNPRIDAIYNAITDEIVNPASGFDLAGHGSHVASIAVSSLVTVDGNYNGIAPGAHLISVQAFDELGQGSYADVIRAIDWVVANKASHNIRVLNLSFSAEPRSHYWDDPINQAVMVAWQQDIVVVAAAGKGNKRTLAYSVFQQGAGLVDALAAVSTPVTGCANQGLDIDADIAGTLHFGGRANQDADGNFYVMGSDLTASDGYSWDGSQSSSSGYLWSNGLTEMATMSSWVEQE